MAATINKKEEEKIVDFFLKEIIKGNNALHNRELQNFRNAGTTARKFIESYLKRRVSPDAQAETDLVIERYHKQERSKRWRALSVRWLAGITGLAVFIFLVYTIYQALGTTHKSEENPDRLYCITASGLRLHDQPGDTFQRVKDMMFGDTILNEQDTIRNIWLKLKKDGKIYYAPKHFIKPFAVYKAIDSLYPSYHFKVGYEDIHSKIAMRTVDVIRNTLNSNMEVWGVPFFSSKKKQKIPQRAVLEVKADSVMIPGEVKPFPKFHTVLLRQRNRDADSNYVYQLLEFHLAPDAEVHLYKNKEFKDRSGFCSIAITDYDAYESGIFLDNIYLTNGQGVKLAWLVSQTANAYWEWYPGKNQ